MIRFWHFAFFFLTIAGNTSATQLIADAPTTIIEGETSGLNRAEGIAFSPSSALVAVANSEGNNIIFYKKNGDSSAHYEAVPAFIIQGPQAQLDYPHDLDFSPDGRHLAVANRSGKSVSIYKKSATHDFYEPIPIAVLKGAELTSPGAIKYSPDKNILAVANTYQHTINFYRFEGDEYQNTPHQIIKNRSFFKPDGLAFSSDGELLAVASVIANSVSILQQIPNSGGRYNGQPVEVIRGAKTSLLYPHSLSFHPTNNYLVVSNPGTSRTVLVFKKVSDGFPRYSKIPEQILKLNGAKFSDLTEQHDHEGGIKGISFSSDGMALGLCSSDIARHDKSVQIYHFSR